jgi:hypothetical protein
MDEGAYQELVAVLGGAQPTLQTSTLADYAVSRVTGARREDLEEIMEMLTELPAVQSTFDLTADELGEELSTADDLDLDQDERDTLDRRLVGLLNLRPFAVAEKALGVLTAYERTLHDARIFTDIRPVFADDPSTVPAAAAVVHTLRLRYHADSDMREFFVALTPTDIRAIRDALDRADAKATSLMSLLGSMSVPNLNDRAG